MSKFPAIVTSGLMRLVLITFISSVANAYGSSPVQDTLATSQLKRMSLEELMDIEVTSISRRPEKLSETASAIQVITGEDIRRSGASSIPEALRLADNLQVAQKASHAWGVSARGFNTELANKLLVMIDGRTVYTPLFSGVFWERQDYLLEDIDRIEVVSGPGGTLWGANAVNGVINIITRSAEASQGFYGEGGGGMKLQDFAGLRYGGTLATDAYFRVYGKYFDRLSQVTANGTEVSDSWRMGQGGFRIDMGASSQNAFTLQGDLYTTDQALTSGGRARVIGGNILGRWSYVVSAESEMSLQLYYDRTHLHDPVPAFVSGPTVIAPAGVLKDDLHTYDLDFQHHFRLGDFNRLVWGIGYRFSHDVVENAPQLGFFPTVLDQNLFSGFIQDEIGLLEDLLLTLGTKVEHNYYTGFEIEPGARLQWNVVDRQTIWMSVSRSVRTPSRIDRHVAQPTPPYYLFPPPLPQVLLLVGGPAFQSEKVIAYELGYRVQPSPAVTSSISMFYNVYRDIRSTSLSPPDPVFGLPFPLFFENNLEGETYGFELGANFQALEWWRLHAGYSMLKEELRVKEGKLDFSLARNETADPEHQFSLRSSMDLPYKMELDVALRWVDVLHNNNAQVEGSVPAYSELDVRLGWRPAPTFELSVVGQNLLHDHHPEYGFPGPGRVEIGRNVYGKISCVF